MDAQSFILFITFFAALFVTGLFLYGLWKFVTSKEFHEGVRAVAEFLGLARAEENPVLRQGQYPWEAGGVMNPAAVEIDGRTHLFYRAVGSDGVSRLGYASSPDGVHFDERLPYPVFSLDGPDPRALPGRAYMEAMYPALVASGGSWGGVEDPRAVVIDGKLYISFSAFYNWSSLRIGVIALSVDDLIKKRWTWSRPVFLSPEGQVHKNWVLFPEKINGKFAVLHGFAPGGRNYAQVAYLDTLDREPTPYIESDARFRDEIDEHVWDSKLRGAGAPPVKTDAGWLVLYHANDAKEPHRYKLGALLLDLVEPTKILARSHLPLLAPDASYENDGKPGIVYACGATVKQNALRVYYGGGDTTVCTANMSLSDLLAQLMTGGLRPQLVTA